MENSNSGRRFFARTSIVIAGLMGCLAFAGFVKNAIPSGKNDSQETLDKLTRIGRALQLYRQEYGVQPVNERVNFADAGLPNSLSVLTQYPSKAWYVSPSDFKVPNPINPGIAFAFRQTYYEPELYGYKHLPPMGSVFKDRGENLPILEAVDWIKNDDWLKDMDVNLPVVRLDGSVEMVTRNTNKQWEVWKK